MSIYLPADADVRLSTVVAGVESGVEVDAAGGEAASPVEAGMWAAAEAAGLVVVKSEPKKKGK